MNHNTKKMQRLRAITRPIDEIIVHCSATRAGMDYKAEDIDDRHRQEPFNFKCIGYHYVIDLDGTIELGRDLKDAGAHCYGHNVNSIGVCYIGGLDSEGHPADTRTDAQKLALRALLQVLKSVWPQAEIHGHNEYSDKQCPCFDAQREYEDITAVMYYESIR